MKIIHLNYSDISGGAARATYRIHHSLIKKGVTINRPPRDGYMAFIKSPDGISIELLQEGEKQPPQEPWLSMPNDGNW